MTEEVLVLAPDGTQELVTREVTETWVPGELPAPEIN